MMTFSDIANDPTKTAHERKMAALLANGHKADIAIKMHSLFFDFDDDGAASTRWYRAVCEMHGEAVERTETPDLRIISR